MDDNAQHNRSSPSVFGLCNTYDNGNEIKTNTSCNLFIYLYKQASNQFTIPPISLTFGRHCGYHTNSGRLQIPTRATRQTFRVARFFFPMAPSLDGERAGPLANMLFGPKHGGRHH